VRLQSKLALATLSLVIGCSPAIARSPQQDISPDQSQGPGGFGPGSGQARHMGPGGPSGGWGQRDGGWEDGGWRHMRGRGEGRREFGLARLLSKPEVREQLGVTAEQAAKIRQQESDFRKTEIRNRANLEVQRIDLRDLLSADKPDRAAINSKLQEISAARLSMEKSSIDYRLNMRDALTPEQRQKLQEWMKQRREREGGRNGGPRGARGQHGPRGGGRGATPPPNPQGPAPDAPNQ